MNYLTLLPLYEKIFSRVLFRVPDFPKAVFLTFDDGPNSTTTPKILRVLADFGAHATFFIRGDRVPTAPGILLQVHRQGHALGNHGFSHKRLWNKKRREIIWEIEETNRIIEKTVGVQPRFFRPPYGKLRPGMAKLSENLGLKLILWSVDSRDYTDSSTAQDVVRHVLNRATSGSVVLFHDGNRHSAKTLEALPTILQNLRTRGFRFLPLSVLTPVPVSGDVLT